MATKASRKNLGLLLSGRFNYYDFENDYVTEVEQSLSTKYRSDNDWSVIEELTELMRENDLTELYTFKELMQKIKTIPDIPVRQSYAQEFMKMYRE